MRELWIHEAMRPRGPKSGRFAAMQNRQNRRGRWPSCENPPRGKDARHSRRYRLLPRRHRRPASPRRGASRGRVAALGHHRHGRDPGDATKPRTTVVTEELRRSKRVIRTRIQTVWPHPKAPPWASARSDPPGMQGSSVDAVGSCRPTDQPGGVASQALSRSRRCAAHPAGVSRHSCSCWS